MKIMLIAIIFGILSNNIAISKEIKPTRIFPEVTLLGEQKESAIREYLKEIGDKDATVQDSEVSLIYEATLPKTKKITKEDLNNINKAVINEDDNKWYNYWSKSPVAWKHTQTQIGFVTSTSSEYKIITPAHKIKPEKIKTATIRLDKIRVYDYPGSGMHNLLFTFEATNGIASGLKENLIFNQTYKAAETEGAGITGYPIFSNLNISADGVSFKAAIINVSNDADEAILNILDNKESKAGLSLLTTAQPALAPFTEMALGVSKMILTRNKNKLVQEVYLGLDNDTTAAFGARLSAGNYIVVQAPDISFLWSDWEYDSTNARLVSKKDHKSLPPYNYFVFRVTKIN